MENQIYIFFTSLQIKFTTKGTHKSSSSQQHNYKKNNKKPSSYYHRKYQSKKTQSTLLIHNQSIYYIDLYICRKTQESNIEKEVQYKLA